MRTVDHSSEPLRMLRELCNKAANDSSSTGTILRRPTQCPFSFCHNVESSYTCDSTFFFCLYTPKLVTMLPTPKATVSHGQRVLTGHQHCCSSVVYCLQRGFFVILGIYFSLLFCRHGSWPLSIIHGSIRMLSLRVLGTVHERGRKCTTMERQA